MLIRCRSCTKTWDDKKEDGKRLEATCKRCVARGEPDKGTELLFTLQEMLKDEEFRILWEKELGPKWKEWLQIFG